MNKYQCECGKKALFGEVHVCSLQDDFWTTYLMPGGPPYFLSLKRKGGANKTTCTEAEGQFLRLTGA